MTLLARLRRDDVWIPGLFLAGFLVVLVANGALVMVALRTWSGLETEGAYGKGLAYNESLAAARAQAALGWQAELSFTDEGDRRALIRFALKDRDGRPITADLVSARLVRPTHAGRDLGLTLFDEGGGHYRGRAELPLAGQWDLRLVAVKGERRYELSRRVVVR